MDRLQHRSVVSFTTSPIHLQKGEQHAVLVTVLSNYYVSITELGDCKVRICFIFRALVLPETSMHRRVLREL